MRYRLPDCRSPSGLALDPESGILVAACDNQVAVAVRAANASGPPTDYSGHTIPNTPRNAVNVNGDLHFRNPFGPGRLSVGGDVTYRTQIQFDDANDTAQFVLDKS
jgi:hypothetical protein